MNECLRQDFKRIEARIQAHLQRIRDQAGEVERMIRERDGPVAPGLSAH